MSENSSKDLDKYGVWVKNSPKDISSEPEEVAAAPNAIDDIDIPSDDDMFNDIEFPMTAEDLPQEPEAMPEEDENADTTLSLDELNNITADQEMATEEPPVEEPAIEEPTIEEPVMEEISVDTGLDDFNVDDLDISSEEAPAAEPSVPEEKAEEPLPDPAATEEISLDDIPDGEVDLDDFMSDSPAPSADATADGEVDLSAFMDDSGSGDGDIDLSAFMDDAPSSKKGPEPEEIQDEKQLDIDVSFDESASSIAQEDNSDETESAAAPEKPAESMDASEMFNSIGQEEKKPAEKKAAVPNGDEEAIDLSEFGFDDDDSNIGMTAGPDTSAPVKQEVVDYDMKVSTEDDTKTVSVQDVVNGKVDDDVTDSTEDTVVEEMDTQAAPSAESPEISEKGKEILEQIMGELSSLKNEIKNLKTDFEGLKSRPSLAAEDASTPAAAQTSEAKKEDTGFFSADDDGDDTIALSGSELTNILNSAEFSTEDAAEPEADVADDLTMDISDSDMEEPKIDTTEVTPEDLENTTDEFGEANVLPEEISVPKTDNLDDITVDSSSNDLMDSVKITDTQEEAINEDGVEEFLAEDVSVSDSLTEEKVDYLEEEGSEVSVDDIVKENISLQEGNEASVTVHDDLAAAFDEADAAESDIADSALAEKEAYENSVSDIVKENISLQEGNEASVTVHDDLAAAFDEAEAAESDIADSALAEKEAYENSRAINDAVSADEIQADTALEDFNLDDGTDDSLEVPDTIDESILSADAATGTDSLGDEVDLSAFDEPVLDETPAAEETVAEEPAADELSIDDVPIEDVTIEEPVVEEPIAEEPEIAEMAVEEPVMEEASFEEPTLSEPVVAAAPIAPQETPSSNAEMTKIPKDLKGEIISVLSYMDQLLENLPEEKISEFAKSEHFVTYKKLFDELGLS